MNEKQARRHNREVKRRRGFEKLAPRRISSVVKRAIQATAQTVKTELP